jgi:hypothetical protein
VHFMDAATGEFAARIGLGGGRVTAAPVTAGDLLLIVNDSGRLTALRAVAPKK